MQAILNETVIIAALVFVASLVLHYLAFNKGILDGHPEKNEKKQRAASSEDLSESESNPLLKKWLAFGGGYYGTVAFVKLILIEVAQARDLATNWQGLDGIATDFGLNRLINLAVGFFVEQFQNFVKAISWPAYYVSNFPIWQCAIFVITTYLIFSGARQLAWNRYTENQRRTG